MMLNEREKGILRLKAEGVSDYRIARELKMETPNVTRSRKNALKARAKADLEFPDQQKNRCSIQRSTLIRGMKPIET